MFPFLRQHFRLLSIWLLLVPALLFANPWGQFGWVELAACMGPFVLGLDRRAHRELAFAVGLPAIALLCVLEPDVAILPRLIVAWVVFAAGVILTARSVDGQQALESVAGHVAFAPPEARAFEEFQMTLEREFGRARRHGRAFVLLSVGADPRSLELGQARGTSGDLLKELAENRARLEISDLLVRELHLYAEVVAARDRVLALVPEVEAEAVEALVARVQYAIGDALDFEAQIGVGCFPRDAICVDELIAAADRDRKNSKLRRLPDRTVEPDSLEPDEFAREVES